MLVSPQSDGVRAAASPLLVQSILTGHQLVVAFSALTADAPEPVVGHS
ncbi:hypothetical protein [Herbiconiux sp. UC225_62]